MVLQLVLVVVLVMIKLHNEHSDVVRAAQTQSQLTQLQRSVLRRTTSLHQLLRASHGIGAGHDVPEPIGRDDEERVVRGDVPRGYLGVGDHQVRVQHLGMSLRPQVQRVRQSDARLQRLVVRIANRSSHAQLAHDAMTHAPRHLLGLRYSQTHTHTQVVNKMMMITMMMIMIVIANIIIITYTLLYVSIAEIHSPESADVQLSVVTDSAHKTQRS